MKRNFEILITIFLLLSTSQAYSDVDDKHWGNQAIEDLRREGIVVGYPDGTFKPDEKMKTGEFLSIFCKVQDFNVGVSEGAHWAENYKRELEAKNILVTQEYSKFDLDREITREEVVKMISRAFSGIHAECEKFSESDSGFLDVSIRNLEASSIVKTLKTAGVFNGYPDGTAKLGNSATRAEICTLIKNVKGNKEYLEKFGQGIQNQYKDDIVKYSKTQMYPRLQPMKKSEDYEYITTVIRNLEVFDFNKEYDGKYKDIVDTIFNVDDLYCNFKEKASNGKVAIGVEFETINNCQECDAFAGYGYLHLSFPKSPNVIIEDAFDTDEIIRQRAKDPSPAVILHPKQSHISNAIYILNSEPIEEILVERAATTLYDSKNQEFKEVNSFFSAIIEI